jgi:hypothetical protein
MSSDLKIETQHESEATLVAPQAEQSPVHLVNPTTSTTTQNEQKKDDVTILFFFAKIFFCYSLPLLALSSLPFCFCVSVILDKASTEDPCPCSSSLGQYSVGLVLPFCC